MPFSPHTIERLFKVLGDENRLRILQARPVPVFDAAWREALARHPLSPGRRPPGEEAP